MAWRPKKYKKCHLEADLKASGRNTPPVPLAGVVAVTVTFNDVPGTVVYAGAQGTFLGLDQVNVVIPQNAGLHGDVVVALTAAGLAANPVYLTFE